MVKQFIINNIAEYKLVAESLSSLLRKNKVVAFFGEMGVGKTTLIKEICHTLAVEDLVSSPTFSIVNEYLSTTGTTVFHFDFYRIDDINEVYDLGYEEYFYSDAICLVEWSEKITALLPENIIQIHMTEQKDGSRMVEIKN